MRNRWIWALTLTLSKYYQFHTTELPDTKHNVVFRDEGGEPLPQLVLLRNQARDFQIIRIQGASFVWGSTLTRDIRQLADQLPAFRKRLRARKLEVINLYVFPFEPVSSIQERLDEMQILEEDDRITMTSYPIFLNDLYVPYADQSEQVQEKETEEKEIQLAQLDWSRWDIDTSQVAAHMRKHFLHLTVEEMKHELRQEERKKEKQFASIFKFGRPILTYAFLVLNALVYFFLEYVGSSTDPETLITYGAKWNPSIVDGQYWRLLSAMFLHIGILHIIMNSIALYFLGSLVERIYGSLRFLWIYLFAGFAGTLASFAFVDNLAAGASGAIFGCFGALLYFGLKYRDLFFRTLGMDVLIILLINLGIGAVIPMIDNYGHVGGLLGGFSAAVMLSLPHKRAVLERVGATVVTVVLVVGLILFGFKQAGTSPYYFLHHAGLALERNDQAEARWFVAQARELAYDEPEFDIQLGMVYNQLQDYDEAVTLLEQAEQKGAQYEALFIEHGVALMGLERYDEARDQLTQVIRRSPHLEEPYLRLAFLLMQMSQWEEAAEVLDRAEERDIESERMAMLRDMIDRRTIGEYPEP
ncbi:rhomboid family intramembrane serine protease [Caldalkalibacillus salinus]|uniref:rhomboid family intramembrane serine protease n=1 Tax=Caldalkalibacillus salinus TaxID=2803787 RepID=UPI0019216EE1|nr:rhomboid family intramembrane serine protease [Caldalkalibacillus salinus]